MPHPKDLFIKDFSYLLPEEKIAKYPLKNRDSAKLLIYKAGIIYEDIYVNIAEHIPFESLAIFNNTKVIEARLFFETTNGKRIEIFCLSPNEADLEISTALGKKSEVLWNCYIGSISKWDRNRPLIKIINIGEREVILSAKYISKINDYHLIRFFWDDSDLSFIEVLHYAGVIPLPPYIKRMAEDSDSKRYQTVYARQEGSVASPTAGLHFTSRVFDELNKKKIKTDFITLHVGAGTFKPVKSETMTGHNMHSEFFSVSLELIKNIRVNLNTSIVSVGTTTIRTLESLYWFGTKIKLGIEISTTPALSQWEVYDLSSHPVTAYESISYLISWMEVRNMNQLTGSTQIIIAPGYEFKIAKALVTNFHQPTSTLILLIAAAVGDDWKKIYDYALNNNFRFLSYGDGSLLWINK